MARSRLANYARRKGIVYLFVGSDGDVLYFNVREIDSPRVRRFFERLVAEDSLPATVDIQYVAQGKSLLP